MHLPRLLISLVMVTAVFAVEPLGLTHERAISEYGAKLRISSQTARVRQTSSVPGLLSGGREALTHALASWSNTNCVTLTLAAEDDPQNALFEVRPVAEGWKYGEAIAAHTDVKSDPFTGEIVSAVIEIDASRRYSEASETPKDALDYETIVLHELGHAIGLGHSNEPSAVMRAGLKPGDRPRRSLSEDDIAGICQAPKANPNPIITPKETRPTTRGGASVWSWLVFLPALLGSVVVLIWRWRKH